jgi:hypothetical protein
MHRKAQQRRQRTTMESNSLEIKFVLIVQKQRQERRMCLKETILSMPQATESACLWTYAASKQQAMEDQSLGCW